MTTPHNGRKKTVEEQLEELEQIVAKHALQRPPVARVSASPHQEPPMPSVRNTSQDDYWPPAGRSFASTYTSFLGCF